MRTAPSAAHSVSLELDYYFGYATFKIAAYCILELQKKKKYVLSCYVLFLVVRKTSTTERGAAYPPTPNSTPADGAFSPDAPIQFDLTTPGTCVSPKEGPPKYVAANGTSQFGIVILSVMVIFLQCDK